MAWTENARLKAKESKRRTGKTNQYSDPDYKMSETTKNKLSAGFFKGKKHSEKTKALMSAKALVSNHRRLVKSCRDYTTKSGEIVKLDSSWEEALAVVLDRDNINWIRPEPMKWIDKTGAQRNYFPDFYLPDYDLFLDPKNPEAAKQQNEKVTWLKTNVKNLVFLHTIEDINNFCLDGVMDSTRNF